MEIEYSNNRLKKQLSNASAIKQAFGVNAKRVSARMDDIISSPTLAVLIQIKAAHCHQLSGTRSHQWAVDISGNDRLVFEIATDPIPKKEDNGIDTSKVTAIKLIEIIDYH